VPLLAVLRRAGPPAGVQDGQDVGFADCFIAEASDHPQAPDGRLDLHRPESKLGAVPELKKDRFPEIIEVVVEIPSGSRNKYEYNEESGVIWLDRVLSSAVFYNFDYGYVEETRGGDGDHTDALVLLAEPTFPGCHLWGRPVGGLRMTDDKGDDFKVLCVALGDPLWSETTNLDEVSSHRLREIEHFFATYKLLEEKSVDIGGWADREAALDVLAEDRRRWLAEQR
jgi:inorganic pyrophosphatase